MPSFTLGFRKVGTVEKRRDKRHAAPVFSVKIDGQTCQSINWSLGGLLVRNHRGYLAPNRVVRVEITEHLSATQRDSRLGRAGPAVYMVDGQVVHCNQAKHQLAVRFVHLPQPLLKFFERHLIAYRRRGY
ncbi:hypothetical protein [Dongia sp.]|uniref:hypothetical protein n=1 Tax=Dongia sp. TaxID=1977262 RepID=UPI0035B290FF